MLTSDLVLRVLKTTKIKALVGHKLTVPQIPPPTVAQHHNTGLRRVLNRYTAQQSP